MLCVTNSWQKSPKNQHIIPQGSIGMLVEPAGILINDLVVRDSPVMSCRESRIQSHDLTLSILVLYLQDQYTSEVSSLSYETVTLVT